MKHTTAIILIGLMCGGCASIKDWFKKIEVKPPVITVPDIGTTTTTSNTTTTTQPTAVLPCKCGERVSWKGVPEQISPFYNGDFRCLINDGTGDESWVTDRVVSGGHVTISDSKMSVACFELEPGIFAHYVGMKQPSSGGPMITGQGVAVSRSGTLRCYFESRRAK